jgi:predicted dehydrogenase
MNFAIVGAGAIAELRRAAIDALEGARCLAVHDLDQGRADALAGGARVAPSLDALLEDPEVEAVLVCTPPDTHERIAVAALTAGKHVIVEKPMANTLDACRRMIETARRENRVLTVGFNHRYFPAIRDVREAVASGVLGELGYVRGFAGHTGLSEFKAEWMYAKDVMGGGALMDNGIHMIDLVRHLMGPVREVYGKALGRIWNLPGVEDNAFALLSGPDGTVGSLNASWTEWKGYHFYVEAYGTRGMARAYYAPMRSTVITMDRPGGRRQRRSNFYVPLIFREKLRGWQSTAVDTLVAELADFRRLVQGHEPVGPIARAEDGYRAVEVAEAVYTATATGRPIPLAETV